MWRRICEECVLYAKLPRRYAFADTILLPLYASERKIYEVRELVAGLFCDPPPNIVVVTANIESVMLEID